MFNKENILKLITNETLIILKASEVIQIALILQVFNISCQIYKYSLNSIREESWTLYATTGTSIISLFIIYILSISINYGLNGIFIGLGINYLILSLCFMRKYYKSIKLEGSYKNTQK